MVTSTTTNRDLCKSCLCATTPTDKEVGYCTNCFQPLGEAMTKVKGHSNAMVDQVRTISTTQALIPIHGGASMATYRALPSLILTKEEWRMIGEAAGWNKASEVEVALRDICIHPSLGKVRPTGINRVKNYTFTPEQLHRARVALGVEQGDIEQGKRARA